MDLPIHLVMYSKTKERESLARYQQDCPLILAIQSIRLSQLEKIVIMMQGEKVYRPRG